MKYQRHSLNKYFLKILYKHIFYLHFQGSFFLLFSCPKRTQHISIIISILIHQGTRTGKAKTEWTAKSPQFIHLWKSRNL